MAHINNKLAAYLDEELDARIRAQVEEHLNVCQRCRQNWRKSDSGQSMPKNDRCLRHLKRFGKILRRK